MSVLDSFQLDRSSPVAIATPQLFFIIIIQVNEERREILCTKMSSSMYIR